MELIRWYGKHPRRHRARDALLRRYGRRRDAHQPRADTAPTPTSTSYLFGSLSTVSDVGRDRDRRCSPPSWCWSRSGCAGSCSRSARTRSSPGSPGCRCAPLNLLIAVTAAVTVTVAMRVVGLLLVSALMVVPVAAAQQITRGFAATFAVAVAIGVAVTLSRHRDLVLPGRPARRDHRAARHRRCSSLLTALATPLARRRAAAARRRRRRRVRRR